MALGASFKKHIVAPFNNVQFFVTVKNYIDAAFDRAFHLHHNSKKTPPAHTETANQAHDPAIGPDDVPLVEMAHRVEDAVQAVGDVAEAVEAVESDVEAEELEPIDGSD
jgi:hypothetical protein